LTLVFNFQALQSFLDFAENPSWGKYGMGVGVLVLVGITIYAFRNFLRRFPLFKRIELFLTGIWTGFKSILLLKERTKFILYSFAIWICYFLTTYLVLFAFPETSHFGL